MSKNKGREFTNVQAVLLALLGLGGDQADVDTEDVAVRAHAISPGRFAWRKYKEFISLEDVRIALKDAKKLDLAVGGTKRGWHLTNTGAAWAREHQEYVEKGLGPTDRQDREVSRRQGLEKMRLVDLSAWRKYAAGEEVTLREAEAVFRLTEYTDQHRRSLLVERMRSLFGTDQDIGDFINSMATIVIRAEEELRDDDE